jgi:ABC-2 type transport system ATP-binding protein
VGTYSKGMRQRLAIARALLHEPALLFLDEPTVGLDPAAARLVTDLIAQLSHREGRTIFLCTHNLTEAQRLCDRVGVIDEGRLRALGAPGQLARELWSGTWVEIDLRGPAPQAVSSALDEMPVVRSHSAQNGVLKVEVANDLAIPDVVSRVAASGGRIYRVVPQEHSLEEIYFQIQGNQHIEEMERGA